MVWSTCNVLVFHVSFQTLKIHLLQFITPEIHQLFKRFAKFMLWLADLKKKSLSHFQASAYTACINEIIISDWIRPHSSRLRRKAYSLTSCWAPLYCLLVSECFYETKMWDTNSIHFPLVSLSSLISSCSLEPSEFCLITSRSSIMKT